MATRKGGGAKTTRSETVTVRLDPELRYLAEIASRTQRRTLSSYIEWAIQDSLSRVQLDEQDNATVADMSRRLWDVDEADRFVKLAIHAPHLLNYDEQRLWKVIREYGFLWTGWWYPIGSMQEWRWNVDEASINWQRLRDLWLSLNAVAAGDGHESELLPAWQRERSAPGDMDEIPF